MNDELAKAAVPASSAETAAESAPASISELASAAPTVDAAVGTAIGDLAPDFALPGDDGQTYRLSDFRGRPVLLNFWATWCGPCRVEMPAFQQAHEAGGDLAILAVDYGETAEDVAAYRTEMGVTFPLLVDETMEIGDTFGVAQIPSTFLIGPDGRIVDVHYGPLTVEQIAEKAASAAG